MLTTRVGMFRRSRFSVRPNVGGPGRTGAAPQEATPGGKEASQAPKAISEGAPLSTVDDCKPGDTPVAAPTALGDGNEPSGEASSAAVQRRKRFSVKPRVAPGRPSIVPRVPKSPAKLVPESPAKVSELESTTSNEAKSPAATPQAPSSPMPTTDTKLPHVQPTFSPPEGCADALKEAPPLPDLGKQTEKSPNSSIKVPHRPLDKVSLPDREAAELSEKAKTLLSSKGKKSIARFSLSRLLNDPSDIQRLENAEKLRDLLRQEMRKEKGIKKRKKPVKEFSVDPTKMTMRDLIRYLPLSNPMSSSLEDDTEQNETVTPFTPRMEILPERTQEPEAEVVPAVVDQTEEEEEDVEGPGQGDEEDDALMVPQVKVAEDGTLILDEESLTVEVQRAKGPNPAEGRDPIFERGSTTTYSSFRASTYCKPWSSEETDMFFLAISMVGTDFSMICQLFHNRTRSEIRNKFKKEEKQNSWRVDKAFRERRKLDIEYFSKLLEKILEVQLSRKKLKSLVVKNPPKKSQGKSKGRKRKKAAGKLSASEEEDEVEEDSLLCSEAEDGEKENEGGTLSSKVKKKLKSKVDASAAKPAKKKSKASEKSSEEGEDEACLPEDTEAALPEDHPDSEVCESAETEKASNGATITPAKLPRGGAAKSVGRKCSKKLPPSPTTAAEDGDGESAKQDESVKDDASKDQVNKEALPSREASDDDVDDSCSDEDSGDEDYSVKPAKPTRSGRIPKPTALLSYPAPSTRTAPKRDRTTKAPSAAPSSKKPKLVMLRATQSESSAEELEEEDMKELWCDNSTQAFVPASLRSPHAVICQVEEAVEELDILADMSVLDMSQDELCLNSSCERAQIETGSRETSAHQLDLLVDVIDLLSSEHAGVSEVESYNEAAQTLLAIGNVSHPSQSDTTQGQITGVPSDSGYETSRRLEEEIVAEFIEENTSTPIMSVPLDQKVTDAFETAPVGPTNAESSPHVGEETCCEQRHVSDHDLTRPLQSNTRTRIARSSKVKPKPNLAKALRAAHSKTQPETSSQGSTMESHSVAPDLSKDLSEEPSSKIAKCSQSSEKQTFDMHAKSTDAEKSESEASDAAVTETLAQESGYVAMPVVHEGQNSSELLSSRPTRTTTSKVEPQPTCTFSPKKISPSANSSSSVTTTMSLSSNLVEELASSGMKNTHTGLTNQLSSESKPTDAEKKKVECSPNEAAAFDDAVTEPLTQESNMHLIQKGEDNGAMIEVHEGQNSSEHRSSPPFKRNRFHRVKPKPNLSQISKSARSKPQTTNETSDSSKLESTWTTTSMVNPQPTCTFSPKKTSPSANSASSVTTAMDIRPNLVPPEELTCGEIVTSTENYEQLNIETKSTDAEQFEFGSNKEAADDDAVTEPLAQESSMPLIQKGGFNDNMPEAHEGLDSSELLSSPPFKMNPFHRVKPKPNLSQISKSARSKPQTTNETSDSSKLESTWTTTSMVKPQPTCTFSATKTSPSANSTSSVTTTMDVSSNLVPTEELASGEIVTSTGQNEQFNIETKSTDAEQFEFGSNEEATADDAVTEPLAQESSMPLIQKGGFNDNMPEAHEGQDSSELQSSPPFKRNRFHRVKPKPNLSQISKSARSKPQTTNETSDSSKLESTWTTTSMVKPQPTCTFSATKTSPSANSTSSVTTTMDVSSNLVPTEELASGEIVTSTGQNEQFNIETKSTDAEQFEFGSNKEAAADDAVTEPLAQESSMPLIQKGGFNDNMPEAHEGLDSSELLSSPPFKMNPFHRVKPKPNLSQISKSARSKPQTTNETSDSSKLESTWTTTSMVKPQPTCTFSATKTSPSANSTSSVTTTMDVSSNLVPTEELASGEIVTSTGQNEQFNIETKSTDAEQFEFGSNKEAAADDAVTEPLAQESSMPLIQKGGFNDNMPEAHEGLDSSELLSSPPFKMNPFHRVKPKPNLSQISKSARSKPQTTNETSDSSKLESTWTTTSMVKPQPTCTFSATKTSPSANSTSSVTTTMDVSSNLVPTEELASGEIVTSTGNYEQFNIETKSTDAEQFEFGSNEETAADDAVTEPLAQESSMPLIQKGGFNDNMPEAHEGLDSSELLSSPPFKMNRFHRVKPKPNLSQISKSARSKPQTTKETSDSSKLESTWTTTSMVKPQPTCTFSATKTSPSANSTSSVTTTMDVSSNLVPTEELASGEIVTSTGQNEQFNIETKSTDAEQFEFGSNKEAAADDAVTEPLAQESSMPLIQKGGFNDNMPEAHEGLDSSELLSSPPFKMNPFHRVKPKPNLSQISKSARSKPQTTNETSDSSKLESTWTTTSMVKPQATCTFSATKTSPSANSTSSVTTTMDVSSNLVPTEELASGEIVTSTGQNEQFNIETKSTDAEQFEFGSNEEATADDAVTEPLAQESSMPLIQKGGFNDNMPEAHEGLDSSELLSSPPFKRNRFHRVKPKPNLSQISKSARSKPQTTNETSDSSKLESTWTTTSMVKPQPTCTFSATKTSPSANSTSSVTTTMDVSSNLVPTEELASGEIETSTGNDEQLNIETNSTDAEQFEFGSNKEAAADDAATEPLAQESSMSLIQKGGFNDNMPEAHEGLDSSELLSSPPFKINRFHRVKPKPNLSQISKSARSKPQTTNETSDSSKLESTWTTTSMVKSQPTCTFSPEKTSQCANSASSVLTTMNLSSNLVPTEELASGEIVTSTGNDEQFNIETKSTDAEQFEFGSNEETAADDAVTEPLAQESSMPLIQKGGFNDNMPEAHEGQDSSELQSSPPFKRNRFHRVKPKPNLSQISKSARSKPQTTKETSDSSKLESTWTTTSMVKPQPTCTFSPEKTSQCANSTSSVLTTMNLSSNLVPTEELTFSEIETSTGCDDQLSSEPKSTDAEEIEYGANKEAASDDAVTEPLAQKSSMPLIHKGGFKDSMPEVHEGQNSSELQSSPLLKRNRFQRVKPKPNLTQISKRTRSEPQVIEETSQSSKLESTWTTTSKVETQPTCIFSPEKTIQSADSASFVTTTMNLSSNRVPTEELASSGMKNTSTRLANQLSSEPKPMDAEKKKVECSPNKEAASDDAVTEPLAQESSMPLVQECGNNDSMPEVHEGQNSSELQSSQPFRRNRFHRFKPNLSHISKCARSKPQATNETSQSSKLESTWTTTSNFLPEEASPSADSASFVATAMNFSTIQVSKEELSSSEVKTSTGLSNQLSSEPKPTDDENIEFGPHKAAASGDAVTELLAQESKTCSIQESGGHDTLPEVYECQRSSEPPQFQPTKRSRLQRVKPKPNLSQISKSARSKPQITKETIMSTNLECTGKITTKVETQPTCTFSPEKPSPKDSVVTPSMDSSTSLVPRAELTSTQEKKAVELTYQEESSLPVVDARKENTGVKEAIFGPANETVRFNAELTQSSSNNLVPSDIIPECQVGVGANANQSTIHKVSNHLEKASKSDLKCESSDDRSVEAESPSTSETSQSVTLPLEICLAYQPTEDLSSSRDTNKKADSEAPKHTPGTIQRRQHLPKVKPALRFPARAIRSTSQSKDGGESFNITSECQVVEKKKKVVMETEEKSNEEGYNAPCQDKKEDRTYLKSDDQHIAAAPSNTQLLHQDTVPEHSKTVQTNKMMTETQPLQSANDPPLPKTTATRRSRLVKPKPNLGKSGRQARQVAAKADSDAVKAPGSQEILPEPVQPVEGAIGLSAMECTTQDESTSSTGQEQTFASLSILQDALSVPSDPDEPFFILSLTEIPVDTVEEVLNPSTQLPPFICHPNQSVQQSLAVENVIAGPDGSTPDVLVSTEQTATTMTPAIVDPVAPPERHQGCASAGPSSTASSPKRKPKGFLSFLSRTPSVGKAAPRRSRGKKPTTTTHPPAETHLAAAELSSAPQRHLRLHANDDAPVAPSQVSACERDDGEAVQQEPSDVSQFFLSDIFTEV
ncbi:uncharacterized protein [Nerophis lumbriciformis]|uniref:uncharacterized protein n=1 Tax=Nerophis lumbriciformis TaxID=546530 RepID=UPI002ADFE7D9|nr:mucin-3B-like [Nerophis lumbriciformis]